MSALERRARVRVQNPLAMAEDADLEPNIMLLRPGRYREQHPTPTDVLLLVEITDTTLVYDLETKALRYAQASIPEYWVYLVNGPELVVHRNPSPDGYKLIARHSPGEPVAPLAFPDVSFDLAVLLD